MPPFPRGAGRRFAPGMRARETQTKGPGVKSPPLPPLLPHGNPVKNRGKRTPWRFPNFFCVACGSERKNGLRLVPQATQRNATPPDGGNPLGARSNPTRDCRQTPRGVAVKPRVGLSSNPARGLTSRPGGLKRLGGLPRPCGLRK